MTPLFKKLNYKNQTTVLVVDAPDTFATEIQAMEATAAFEFDMVNSASIDFVLVFVTRLQEIETAITVIHPKLTTDAVLWFCYPKGTSKKYRCEFNRDNGWEALGKLGFEPVRMVAIDADWSALRFRKAEHIKSLTRKTSLAISEAGQSRTQKK